MNFKDLGLRFSKYLIYKGIKNKKVAEDLQFSASQVTNIIKGRVFGSDKLFKILNFYNDMDANWLLTGQGEMLKNDNITKISIHDENIDNSSFLKDKEKIIALQDEKIQRLEKDLKERDKEILHLKKETKRPNISENPIKS